MYTLHLDKKQWRIGIAAPFLLANWTNHTIGGRVGTLQQALDQGRGILKKGVGADRTQVIETCQDKSESTHSRPF